MCEPSLLWVTLRSHVSWHPSFSSRILAFRRERRVKRYALYVGHMHLNWEARVSVRRWQRTLAVTSERRRLILWNRTKQVTSLQPSADSMSDEKNLKRLTPTKSNQPSSSKLCARLARGMLAGDLLSPCVSHDK